jgi:two-component system, NarL family, nitrate/nitrite response regulator NarL
MPKKVLLVDDQELVRSGLKSMLQLVAPAVAIDQAGSCAEAKALLQAVRFDIAFIDLELQSEHSGLDVLQYLRERCLPVRAVMLSDSDDPDTVLHCIAAGACGYITKRVGDERMLAQAFSAAFSEGIFLPASIVTAIRERLAPERVAGGGRSLAPMGFSPRLTEALYYLCQGLSNQDIADRMGIGEGTVRKSYVSELLRAFGVARRSALIIEVNRRGLLVPPPRGHAPPHGRWRPAAGKQPVA